MTADGEVTREDVEQYLRLLTTADEFAAIRLAERLLDRGVPAERILVDLIAPVQEQVGARWASNAWSVAEEHTATHISERVVDAVAPVGPDGRDRILVSCVDGEWHALPARLCAEILRLNGWSVRFLGASVPTPDLIACLHEANLVALALSCSLPACLPAAHQTIRAARASGIPVLAGGAGFGRSGQWARRLGADGHAPSASDALLVLANWPPPAIPESELRHLADNEYQLVMKRRPDLIGAALTDLTARFPHLADGTSAHRTAADIAGQLVDYLGAALYVDDASLFAGFVSWAGDILEARDLTRAGIGHTLDGFAAALYDSPRARRILFDARNRDADPGASGEPV